MLWYVLANEFATKNNMPKWLISFAHCIERTLSCKYFQKSLNLYQKSSNKTLAESHSAALNYAAFSVMFLIMFVCNLAIWISII